VRNSVLESDAYTNLPHRDEYTGTAEIARDVQPVVRYEAVQDVLNRELQAIWLTGKPIAEALSDADAAVQDLLY
jgi:multiple sugar transport system substrate-binding protein